MLEQHRNLEPREGYDPISTSAKDVLLFYEQTIAEPHVVDVGPATILPPRFEGDESPLALREYNVEYPPSLNQAFKIVAQQHDAALMQLVERHRELSTDYHLAPSSLAFQIDGPAFSDKFLEYAQNIDPEVLSEFLKWRIFEVENNIAGYDLNGRLWPEGTTNATWKNMLEDIRQRTGKKVAVLASTYDKFDALLLSELGITKEDMPSEEVIRSITGFDAFWGPEELIAHHNLYDGSDSDYVFFGRTSRPTEWLKDPTLYVEEPFLEDSRLRAFVRRYALTHNFDNPELGLDDPRVLTDTKEALCMIGASYAITGREDIYSHDILEFLANNNVSLERVVFSEEMTDEKRTKLGKQVSKVFFDQLRNMMLSPAFHSYLETRGVDPMSVATGIRKLRAKPKVKHYGAWGHIRGSVASPSFLTRMVSEQRGPYIIQPEMQNLEVIDKNTGTHYLVIDRVFFVREADGRLRRMEGIRAHMPKNSPEGRKNSVHDGRYTLDAPIAENDGLYEVTLVEQEREVYD